MFKGLATLIAICVAFADSAFALDKVTFQFSFLPTGDYAVYSAGVEKGFYKESGIELTVALGRGSGDAVKKVAGGAAMFGDGDIGSLMAARVNEKAPLKCIINQHDHSPHAAFVLESSGIKSIKDLAGKTLATTPGNSHYLYFPFVAKRVGLDPSTVKWVNVDVNALAPTLIARKVDSSPMFASHAYWVGKAAKEQGQKLVVLPYADAGFKIYSYCIYTTEDLIAKNPDLVKRFVAATVKSFLWAHENMDEAVAIHHKKYPDIALDDAKGSLSIMYDYIFPVDVKVSDFGRYNQDRLKLTYSAAASAQNLPSDTDVTQFIDMRFLPANPSP